MIQKLKASGKDPKDALEAWRKIPSDKAYLKRRKKLICCERKKPDNERAKYGTSRCDSFSLHYRLGMIIANNLFQYIADAKDKIVRDDWDIIERYAQAIMDFSAADGWDLLSKDSKVKRAYKLKDKNWRQAMDWLAKNWGSLWW